MFDVCNTSVFVYIIMLFILSCDSMEKLKRKCETLDKEGFSKFQGLLFIYI